MIRINTAFLSFVPMNSRVYPDAEVMSIPPANVTNAPTVQAAIDFLQDHVYLLDLTSLLSTNPPKHGIQAMYVNAANMWQGNCAITLKGNTTTQTIVVPAQTQGYYPVICQTGGPLTITFENDVSAVVSNEPVAIDVHLLNIPFVAATWVANLDYQSVTQKSLSFLSGSNTVPTPNYLGDQTYCVDYVNPVGVNNVIPINAIGYRNYYVKNISLSFDPMSGGGNNYVFFADSFAGKVWGSRFSFPTARAASPVAAIMNMSTPPDFFYQSTIPHTSLGFSFFSPLLGSLVVSMNYGVLGG